MKGYKEFPPFAYFLRVLKCCPKSAFLYVQMWGKKNKSPGVVVNKKDIRRDYFITPTIFRNLLEPLRFLNLLSFTESEEKFKIEISGKDE